MTTFESSVLSYVLNAAWQIPLILLAALGISRIAQHATPRFQHRIWVTALLLQAVLPATSLPSPAAFLSRLAWLPWPFHHATGAGNASVTVTLGAASVHSSLHLTQPLLLLIAAAYTGALVYATLRLIWGLRQTHRLTRFAHFVELSTRERATLDRLCLRFGIPAPRFAISDAICGPVTVGTRHPVLLLPGDFRAAVPEEDQDAAFAHELAHIRRRDFALNLGYRLLTLPVAWHPAVRLTSSRLSETREILCDALAAEALAGPSQYARSLLRLAGAFMPAGPIATTHAIGIFDANTLERRIMSLITGRTKLHLMGRLAIGATSVAVALGVCTSAMALRMHVFTPMLQEPASESAVQMAAGVMAGNVLTKVTPVYPPEAKAARISGSVVLAARIGKDGTIQSLKLISGPPELAPSAWDAVKQWTYKPYLLNGEPVAVDTTITVNYQLAAD